MAIVNNTASEIGDVLIIKSQIALYGQANFTGFNDSVNGVTPNRDFSKKFKYSLDNINWSNLIPLTEVAIQSIPAFKAMGLVFFEFYYERIGTDSTGLLEFENIEITGDIVIQVCENTASIDTVFENLICNDYITNEVAINLLRKIYFNGILPKYIERGAEKDDEDFLIFWGAVCYYMAMVISYADRFDRILYDRELLIESLTQRGLNICGEQTILDDLQFLANNFKDEIRKRGTYNIVREKFEKDLSGEQKEIRGELLRTINKNHWDEFLFELMERKHMGYNVDNSSPLYHGTNLSNQLKKSFSDDRILHDGDVTFNEDLILIRPVESEFSGIGVDLENIPEDIESVGTMEHLIPVDREMDYEITFEILRKNVNHNVDLTFGLVGYNRNGILQTRGIVKTTSPNSIDNEFFTEGLENLAPVINERYFIRGILYAKNAINLTEQQARLNILKGKNLKFAAGIYDSVEHIIPCLYVKSPAVNNAEISIFNFNVRPLVRGKRILPEKGYKEINGLAFPNQPHIENPHFIQQGNTIMSWLKNNSDDWTNTQVENFIENFLIPYQTRFAGIKLNPQVNDKQLLT